MGRIAGEGRGDAYIRRSCIRSIDTLMRLQEPEYDPAIRLKAAGLMVRTFGTGMAAGDGTEQGKRITWEEYVKGVRALDEKARPTADGTAASPDGNGQPTESRHLPMRRNRTPTDPEDPTEH
jgi:hypothetical protein